MPILEPIHTRGTRHTPLAALTTSGIVAALRETAETLAVDVHFTVGSEADEIRFDKHIEATAFYCCAEALQNCVKHSPGFDRATDWPP
jgi:signal transduction histidine kinase